MSSGNQPLLNGADGPAVPPPESDHHRQGRRVREGRFCPGCCISCLSCTGPFLVKRLFMLIIMGIAVFLYLLIVSPSIVNVHVTDASLTEFNYTINSILHYNFALSITIGNHNEEIGIYYEYIEAQTLLFQDARFDSKLLEPFYQGHKNTTVLSHVFRGQQLLALRADQVSELDKEKSKGVYHFQVKLNVKPRFEYAGDKGTMHKYTVTCDLRVPLTSSNSGTSSAGAFQTTKCSGI